MSGFNGSVATPVSSAAAAKQRDALGVYSKSEVDAKTNVSDMTATSSNMTIVRQKIVKDGNIVVMQVVLKANGDIPNNTVIMTLPYYHNATSYYPVYAYDQDSGVTRLLLFDGYKLYYFGGTTLASNHRLAFDCTYINT